VPRRKSNYTEPLNPVVHRDFYNVKQAADYLGCTVSAIRLGFDHGLQRKRVGIRDIVRHDDLVRWFDLLPY